MTLKDCKVAVMAADMYEDLELWYPAMRLKEAGAQVTLVGAKAGATCTSKHGYTCKVDKAAADCKATDFDMVIVPGGYSPDMMRRDESMVNFIQQAAAAKMNIAAICHGGWMLCCTDALKGKTATSWPSIRWDMINAGCKWVDKECVQDGNIITSRCPDDLPAFLTTILQALEQQASKPQRKVA